MRKKLLPVEDLEDTPKRFQCAQKFSSMIAEAGDVQDARIVFRCDGCSLSRLQRCDGPVEYKPKKEPIVIMPPTEEKTPKRRGHKPPLIVPQKEQGVPIVPKTADIPDTPAPEVSKEDLTRSALMELAKPQEFEIRREIVHTFYEEIAAARNAKCGWGRICKTLNRFGYKIGEYAVRKNFERISQA